MPITPLPQSEASLARARCDDLLEKHGYSPSDPYDTTGEYTLRVLAAVIDEVTTTLQELTEMIEGS